MISSSLAGHILELFYIFNTSKSPTNQITKEYFKSRRYLGSHDRRAIANTVFGLIRHRRFLETLSDEYLKQNPKIEIPKERFNYDLPLLVAYCEIIDKGIKIPLSLWKTHLPEIEIISYINWINDNSSLDFLSKDHLLQIGVKYSFPDWMVDIFQKQIGNEIEMLLDSLNTQAPTTLRVNILITTREECQARLRSEGIETTYSKISPVGLIANKRFNSQALNSYKDGWFEIQDEGSQLISLISQPQEGSIVIDACAGAGGKSLHLAELMNNRGEIIALDIDARRLEELSKRAKRGHIDIIKPQIYKPGNNEILRERADLVLVDAPCSGSGTIRRNPRLKWNLKPILIKSYSERQIKILEESKHFVKNDGFLIYATCSLFSIENEIVVKTFLEKNQNYQLCLIKERLTQYNLTSLDPWLTLYPHRYHTDGFFIAVMKKIH